VETLPQRRIATMTPSNETFGFAGERAMKHLPLEQRLLLAAASALAFVGTFALAIVAPLALAGGLA
jgi:hypothetical protein